MIEPIATTVATLDPEMAANIAQAATPARPSPPGKWPTREVVNAIMRRATPPRVKNVPARMKNGIAIMPKLSRPENSFRPTLSIGTSVIVNRNIKTVRPSEIEIGMPVSIRANSRPKMRAALISGFSHRNRRSGRHHLDAIDIGGVVMRQFAGPEVLPAHLKEAEAHQIGTERNAGIDDPTRDLQVGRNLVGAHQLKDKLRTHGADERREQRAAE